MLVQIPVLIAFDAVDATCAYPLSRAAGQRVFTLRYDTDPNANVVAEYSLGYPPGPAAFWLQASEGFFFDMLTSAADKIIAKRATDDPESYAVGESV